MASRMRGSRLGADAVSVCSSARCSCTTWCAVPTLHSSPASHVGWLRRRGASGRGAGRWQVELEEKPRAPARPCLDAELGTHRRDELATDSEPEAGAREMVPRLRLLLAERAVQRPQRRTVDARSGVADRALDAG